jgi:hypothetical protein
MGNDNRGFPRSLVDLVVKIQSRDQWVDCKVIDLSVEGISLEVGQSLSMGELTKVEIEHSEWMKKNQVQVEVIRCDSNPNETNPEVYHVVARLMEPNDEYLMGALNLVHGDGPKQDRRPSGYNKRDDGR